MNLLEFAAAEDWPHDLDPVVTGAVELVVEHRRGVGVADDEFDLVADPRRRRGRGQFDPRVLG